MIQIKNVSKEYKKNNVTVLDDVSLDIKNGEIVALLGHNGSGKSTLLKCITGVIKPTTGNILIDGIDSFKKQKKLVKNMGVVFNQKPSFIVDLEVIDNLLFFKAIYDISKDEFDKMLNLIDKFLNISDLYNKPYRKLSFGERVKCEITSVLLHNPKYIFLDEPTIGLDYNAKKGLYNLLAYFKENYNNTIIVVTHEVDYIQNICDRAIIMNKGKIRYNGSISNITQKIKTVHFLNIKYNNVRDKKRLDNITREAENIDLSTKVVKYKYSNNYEKENIIKSVIEILDIVEIKTEEQSLKEVFESVLQEVNKHSENNGSF